NNGEPVTLKAIDKPDKTFTDLVEPLKAALAHEEYVTSLINTIYAAAQAVNDYRTTQFLDWFIKEQGEEEKNSNDQITKMELYGGDARGLYMLNAELLARTYSAPSLTL
ncbi:MAG: ferritin, partial [Ruminiclostridium sp.]|nr:ferritin [Ruminiclostridium sp.]